MFSVREFHWSLTRTEKKFFLVFSLALGFKSFIECPLVEVSVAGWNNVSLSTLYMPCYIL